MKKINKTVSILTAISIASSTALLPGVSVNAATNVPVISQEQVKTTVEAEDNQAIHLFKDANGTEELGTTIPSNSEITIKELGDLYSLISYQNQEKDKEITGYISNTFVHDIPEFIHNETEEPDSNTSKETDENLVKGDTLDENVPVEKDESTKTVNTNLHEEDSTKKEDASESKTEAENSDSTKSDKIVEDVESPKEVKDESNPNQSMQSIASTDSNEKIETPETEQKVEKAQPKIQARAFAISSTVVSTNTLSGIAIKSPTSVYSSTNGDEVLKNYSEGSLLKFKDYSTEWYQATVYINGKSTTGYIRKTDVEIPTATQTTLKGLAEKDPTKVYSKPSVSASTLKSYSEGTILKIKTFTAEWYQVTIYINGRATTGYIQKADVELPTTTQTTLKGIAKKDSSKVYAKPSVNASTLKSYSEGTILKLKTFTTEWYQVTVYINGKATTGYIRKSDTENIVSTKVSGKGIALLETTKVYSKASQSSTSLKSYAQGTILTYKTFTTNWYEATVYINGKAKVGYIRKADVEELYKSQQSLKGYATESPTKIYSKASRNSTILKKYKVNTVLKYKTLSDNWYEATIYINGKATTGYINVNDVAAQSYYDLSLEEAVTMQATTNPQTDASGSWGDATESQLEYYMNPFNFSPTSNSYYQFLVLSSYAGTDAEELNNTVLKDKGVLSGKGAAFIYAAKKYGISEIYLISHALLETGNGTSPLATGIKVNGTTVYNVYGIGAYDYDPDGEGSKYAYNHDWTSVDEAIIGGAEFVSANYILAGQNTLYKMRWNPEAMSMYGYAYHQYATDVGWAVKQTSSIASIYNLLTKYTLTYDVPTYLVKD